MTILLAMGSQLFAQQNENRSVSGFSKVSISGSFDITLQAGNSEGLKIVAEKSVDLSRIVTEVEGGVLKVYVKSNMGKWQDLNGDVDIFIDFKQLDEIKSSGSSDIVSKGTIRAEAIQLISSGSGDMNLDVDTKKLDANLSGSCDLDLRGTADVADIRISGSGDIKALELKSREASVSISGSGDAALNVSESLEARISGSGNVSYRGRPGVKNVKISGSGNLQQVD